MWLLVRRVRDSWQGCRIFWEGFVESISSGFHTSRIYWDTFINKLSLLKILVCKTFTYPVWLTKILKSVTLQTFIVRYCQTWPTCLVVVTPGGAGDYRDTIAAPHRARYWEIRENQIVITRRLLLLAAGCCWLLLLHLSLARIGSIKRRLSARDTQDVLLITAE